MPRRARPVPVRLARGRRGAPALRPAPYIRGMATTSRPDLRPVTPPAADPNGFTPYIAVHVSAAVQVPMEYVKKGEIVLNISFGATSGLKMDNDSIRFNARFGGVSREIRVPIDHVVAIYARENGQGMAFPVPTTDGARGPVGVPPSPASGQAPTASSAPRTLRRGSGSSDTTRRTTAT